ncbi:MAG: GGDEF domain-containing protein [Treponema sp.]|nr:GGDEF domain-containing protein [Treponema sp.]
MHFGPKKKTIAICVSGFNWEYEVKVINGIVTQSENTDVRILIFSSLMMKAEYPRGVDQDKSFVRGENEIYNMVNYDILDGLILFSGSLYLNETVDKIVAACREKNIPIVNVYRSALFEHNVIIDESSGLEYVVEHLIRDHGLRRLDFIGGYPDNKETITRLDAYKRVLKKYNIPIEEKRIKYGHFWKKSIECTKELLEIDKPDAIVCANDTMAIMVCDYLKNEGYTVPTDIVVTGFDGIVDAYIYNPSITTVRADLDNAGKQAFDLLLKLIDGDSDAEDVYVYPELVIQESCGCVIAKKRDFNYIDSKYVERYLLDTFHKSLIKTDVYFSEAETEDALFLHLLSEVVFFEFDAICFCINSDLSDTKQSYFLKSDDKYGLSETVTTYYMDKKNKLAKQTIKASDLYPKVISSSKGANVFTFSPLYWKKNYIGYVVYSPAKGEVFRDYFQLWLKNISNVIGSYYERKELERLSYRDYMTGLYNRRGIDLISIDAKNKIQSGKGYVTLVCADIDRLKKINDSYGHDAGDTAIIQVAKALKAGFGEQTPCIRTGGDEFSVLLLFERKTDIDRLIQKVEKYLEDFNASSGLQFEVKCSCSYSTVPYSEFTDFTSLYKQADQELYKVKEQHHSQN